MSDNQFIRETVAEVEAEFGVNNCLAKSAEMLAKEVARLQKALTDERGITFEYKTQNDKLRESWTEVQTLAYESRHKVCGYMDSDKHCDCKYLGDSGRGGEQTGCCEFRTIESIARTALKESEAK